MSRDMPDRCLGRWRTLRQRPGMSKARLVITAVTVEKRPVTEVARAYGVARSWIYELLARYRAEGGPACPSPPTRIRE
jgi:transposase